MRSCLAVVVLTMVVGVALPRGQAVTETVLSDRSTSIINAVDERNIAVLARAARVPMGFEGLEPSTPVPGKLSIKTAGRRLREVLDEMVAADPRYEWRDIDGVIVFRPPRAWFEPSPLNSPVGAVSLQNIVASDALEAIAQMVGQSTTGWVTDNHQFSVEVRNTATFFEVLNSIVRAHGSLVWTMTPTNGRDPLFGRNLSLFSGSGGIGFGVRAGALVKSDPIVIHKPKRTSGDATVIDWNQVVPQRAQTGLPIVAYSIHSELVWELARVMHTPMGIEAVDAESEPWRPANVPPGEPPPSVTLSGKTLAQAVADLAAFDPRYQWREMGGVIVFRPVTAWGSSRGPFRRPIDAIRLRDTSLQSVMQALATSLGVTQRIQFDDNHRFSIDAPAGSLLDMLNAIVRAHGHSSWHWTPSEANVRTYSPGMLHRLAVRSMTPGNSVGYLLP